MKKKLTVLLIIIVVSCTNKSNNNAMAYIDNTNDKNKEEKNDKKLLDSTKQNFLDNRKTKKSPVKIVSAILLDNQYSDHKDIKLIYKNVTKKSIKAIKFEWYCENAFDKPASGQYFFVKGVSKGHTDILLKSGKVQSKIWEDFSTDAYTIIAARACYVVFSDGTKWQIK